MYLHTKSQDALLDEIREKRYPIQAATQTSLLHLKMIQVQMENTVLTAELESLHEAERLKEKFKESINKIMQLEPVHVERVDEITRVFDAYFGESWLVASRYLDGGDVSTLAGGTGVYTKYETLISLLETFEKNEAEAFGEKIRELTLETKFYLNLGLPLAFLGIVVISFLAIAAIRFTVQRVNGIVTLSRRLAEQGSDMSERIELDGADEMTELAYWFNKFIEKQDLENTRATEEIRSLAYTDALSGLPNRRLSNDHIQNEIDRNLNVGTDKARSKFAVMFLDLDNFKQVNDQYGHDAGDIVVKTVAERLRASLTALGVELPEVGQLRNLGGKALISRIGGDEFMITLPNIRQDYEVISTAERIRKSVLEPIDVFEATVEIGVSIGISFFPDHGATLRELCINADLAMYDAKSAGKNAYRIYSKELSKDLELRNAVEECLNDLDQGAQAKAFFLEFQPMFTLSTGKIDRAVASLHFHHAELGEVDAAKLSTLMDGKNQSFALDKLALTEVCKQVTQWRNDGAPAITIGVSVSAGHVGSEGFPNYVASVIRSYGLRPQDIEIVIAQTLFVESFEQLSRNVDELRSMSIKVALDDFGVGHSTMAILNNCKIDMIKVDASLVDGFDIKHEKRMLIESAIELAGSLGATVVAKGVKSQAQWHLLRLIKYDMAQGELMSNPMSCDAFIKLVFSQRPALNFSEL